MNNSQPRQPFAASALTALAALLGLALLAVGLWVPSDQFSHWARPIIPPMLLATGIPYVLWPSARGKLPASYFRLVGAFFIVVAAISIIMLIKF